MNKHSLAKAIMALEVDGEEMCEIPKKPIPVSILYTVLYIVLYYFYRPTSDPILKILSF